MAQRGVEPISSSPNALHNLPTFLNIQGRRAGGGDLQVKKQLPKGRRSEATSRRPTGGGTQITPELRLGPSKWHHTWGKQGAGTSEGGVVAREECTNRRVAASTGVVTGVRLWR